MEAVLRILVEQYLVLSEDREDVSGKVEDSNSWLLSGGNF